MRTAAIRFEIYIPFTQLVSSHLKGLKMEHKLMENKLITDIAASTLFGILITYKIYGVAASLAMIYLLVQLDSLRK